MGRAASRGPRLSGPIPSIDNRVRSDEIRAWIRANGSTAFTPEPGRYHLYVSLACPWAHRTLIVRHLKGLNRNISAAAVDPVRDDRGWTFRDGPGYSLDPVSGSAFLKEADLATNPAFQGRRPLEIDWRLFCTLIRFDAGLSRTLQMQPPPDRGLSASSGLPSRLISNPRRRLHRGFRPY